MEKDNIWCLNGKLQCQALLFSALRLHPWHTTRRCVMSLSQRAILSSAPTTFSTPTLGQWPAIGIFIKPDLIIYIQKFSYLKCHESYQDSWSPAPLNFPSVNTTTGMQESKDVETTGKANKTVLYELPLRSGRKD